MSTILVPFSKNKTVHSGRISPNCIGQTDKSEGGLYTKFSLYWSKKLRSRYSSIVKKVKGKFGLLKVRQSRNVFFKATILPKNEFVFFLPINSTMNEFWKNSSIPKSPFEITWPLKSASHEREFSKISLALQWVQFEIKTL